MFDTDVASVLQKGRAPEWVRRHVVGARVWLTFVSVGELVGADQESLGDVMTGARRRSPPSPASSNPSLMASPLRPRSPYRIAESIASSRCDPKRFAPASPSREPALSQRPQRLGGATPVQPVRDVLARVEIRELDDHDRARDRVAALLWRMSGLIVVEPITSRLSNFYLSGAALALLVGPRGFRPGAQRSRLILSTLNLAAVNLVLEFVIAVSASMMR